MNTYELTQLYKSLSKIQQQIVDLILIDMAERNRRVNDG